MCCIITELSTLQVNLNTLLTNYRSCPLNTVTLAFSQSPRRIELDDLEKHMFG